MSGTMLYNHRVQKSLGHQMQVELKENMQSYRDNKTILQNQLSDLRFDVCDLYTSPVPSSPPARSERSDTSIHNWKDAGSKFNAAPNKAAKQARLAKLQHENSILSTKAGSLTCQDLNGKKAALPPIPCQQGDAGQASDTGQSKANCMDATQKSLRFGGSIELKTPQNTPKGKLASKGKTQKAKKPVLKEKHVPFVMKLPTIHAVDQNRPQWDSGHNHVYCKGKSTVFEKSKVEEDCRTFTQRSFNIPNYDDPKRREIKLPPIVRATGPQTKVKFTGRQPRKPIMNVFYTENSVGRSARTFPSPRQPDMQASSEDLYDSDEENGAGEPEESREDQDTEKLELPPLPVVRLSESKLSRHNFVPTTRRVPRLHLDCEATPSLMSEVTGRSGVTAATYMSQETLEWKEEYMASGDPARKTRMLAEILHVVRERMQDNAEDLRMAGYDPLLTEGAGADQPLDIMVLAGKPAPANGNTTPRRIKFSKQSKKSSPNRQLVTPGVQRGHRARLHSYMQRMSQRRRAVEHQQRVRFELANMTIREITQSSLGHSMQQAV
nr:hypothetical protein BaRGS_016311 [Batillaria attramentaria]